MQFSDFGYQENPFSITPDPRYLFLSRGHEESLAHLIYGAGPNGGFVQLTGEVGTGKTLLVRSLLEQHLRDVEFALIFNPHLSPPAFLAAICDELGIEYYGPPYSSKQLSDKLTRHLLATHAKGRNTVLVIDEAQNLSPRVLEQIRMLTNLETARHKLLRIILVGQPELQQLLARKDLRQVAQRITARYHLTPLSRSETAVYVRHRLAVAGVREDLFSPLALRLVHRLSGGVPRMINTLAERTLLAIFATGARRAGARLVWRAAREIKGRRVGGARLRWSLAATLLLASLGGLTWWLQPQLHDRIFAPASLAAPAPELELALPGLPQTVEQPLSMLPIADSIAATVPSPMSELRLPSLSMTLPVPEFAAAQPATLAQRLAEVPDSARATFRRLFALWGRHVDVGSADSACAAAREDGLRCLIGHAGWDQLQRMNRPALLKLELPQGERYIVLKALQSGQPTLDYGSGDRKLRVQEVERLWNGEFLMLWRPLAGADLVGPGSAGPAVVWLRQRLALAEGSTAPAVQTGVSFDPVLGERLKRFQVAHGLSADGIAGQLTMIQLNNLQLPPDTPVLVPRPLVGAR